MNPEITDNTDDPFETLLAECIEAFAEHGPAGIEKVCSAHPGYAPRLQERLASLQRLGLLSGPEAPQKIGHYRILRHLGRGGMSVVYLAQDERLGRRVALKLGHAALVQDDRASLRFQREIRAVVRLQHPCIIQTFDVGEDQGRAYFTMEYVEGTTLARVIANLDEASVAPDQRSGLDIAQAVWRGRDDFAEGAATEEPGPVWNAPYVEVVCRVILDVADALAHAHTHDIIHRDVKPSNIMLRPDGRAQLFDLGLALLKDQPALSASGDFAGTPFYASPEQIAGRSLGVDGRTDVYSLGVTLYEFLSLRRPFEGRGTAEVLKRIQTDDARLLRHANPPVPRDLETITFTAMEKDPARRYADVQAMAADLRRFLEFRPVHAQPQSALTRTARRLRRNPALALAGGLLVLFLVGLPIGLLWANAAIRQQRDRAADAALEAGRQARLNGEVTEFLVELYDLAGSGAGSEVARTSISVEEFLEHGVQRIAADFQGQPLVRAALWEATGRVYFNLGMDDKALPLLGRSLGIRQRELGEAHIDMARLLGLLASIHIHRGEVDAAAGLAGRSMNILGQLDRTGGMPAVQNHMTLAACASLEGDLERARSELQVAVALTLEERGPDSPVLAEAFERSGVLAARVGDRAFALERLQAAHDIRRQQLAPDPLALARNLELQADWHASAGETTPAARLRGQATALRNEREASPTTTDTQRGATFPFDLTPHWKADYDERFQAGITALQSGRWETAIAAFQACLEWRPRHPVCAYNVACGYSLMGQIELGLDWWERAVEFGYGIAPFNATVALKDGDFEPLRDSPRWMQTYERMLERRRAAEEYSAQAFHYIPTDLVEGKPWPLIVLLHGHGETKDNVIDESWRRVADRLGSAILAPSGGIPAADTPRDGMHWFKDLDDLLRRPWLYEKPIIDAVHEFAATHRLDRDQVFIVGEGLAALPAFDLAVAAPGLFRGVLILNGPVHPSPATERLHIANAVGLRLEVLLDARHPIAAAPIPHDPTALAAGTAHWLQSHPLGDRSNVELLEAGATQAALQEALFNSMTHLGQGARRD